MHSLRKREKITGSVHFLSDFLCTGMVWNLYDIMHQQIGWSQNNWLLEVHIYSLSLLINIIENSIFTKRQIQIIYNINNKQKKPLNITSGAFYREKRQCKNKIKKIYFSIIILILMDILKDEHIHTLISIADKILQLVNNYSEHHDNNVIPVMKIIEELINKMLL